MHPSIVKRELPATMEHTGTPHELDVWYFNTGQENSSIPFCSKTEGSVAREHCRDMLLNNSSLDEGDSWVNDRLDCQAYLDVPHYYRDAALDLPSHYITSDSAGNLKFTVPVCACRGFERGLTGPECSSHGIAYVMYLMLALLAIWLIARVVLALRVLFDKNTKSRRKKFLVLMAVLQHVGQILWLVAWLAPYVVFFEDSVYSYYVGSMGFSLATLFMFMFVCELVSQTSAFLRVGAQQQLNSILRRMEVVFAVLPLVVVVATWSLVFNFDTASRLGLLVFQGTVLMSTVSAFSFVIHVLDQKVQRLLPKQQALLVSDSHSLLSRVWRWVSCKRNGNGRKQFGKLDDTSEQLLASSRRLRQKANALRIGLVLYLVFGGLYVVVESTKYTPLKVLRVPEYCIWHLAMSSVSTVGISSLSIMKPLGLRTAIFQATRTGTSNASTNDAESSFVGTLTS
jgi:hypothetical protein